MEKLFDANFRREVGVFRALFIDSAKNLLNAGPMGNQIQGGFLNDRRGEGLD